MRLFEIGLALGLVSKSYTANCGSTTINSAADADALRASCTTVDGSITFGAALSESISLDGVQVVTGSVNSTGCGDEFNRCPATAALSISSSTLTTIHGDFYLGPGLASMVNISLPNLGTVDGAFNVGGLANLTYLDITNLESVGYFHLQASNLTTMLHNELRNVTGVDGVQDVWVVESSLSSVNSLFRNPLDIGNSYASVVTNPNAAQSVTNLTFGFARAGALELEGSGNLFLTLGGPSTTNMSITNLTFQNGVSGLTRSSTLTNLTVENIYLAGGNNYTELLLPFDSVSKLDVYSEETLIRLSLPPQAINYSNFSFITENTPNLNMTSQFVIGPDGSPVQTWYWPQHDMHQLSIIGQLATAFFQTWFDFEGQFQNGTGRPVVSAFFIEPSDPSLVSCTPFDTLYSEGVIPGKITSPQYCSSATWRFLTTSTLWWSLLIGVGVQFML